MAASDLFLAPYSDGVTTRRTILMAALQHGLCIAPPSATALIPCYANRRWRSFRYPTARPSRRWSALSPPTRAAAGTAVWPRAGCTNSTSRGASSPSASCEPSSSPAELSAAYEAPATDVRSGTTTTSSPGTFSITPIPKPSCVQSATNSWCGNCVRSRSHSSGTSPA